MFSTKNIKISILFVLFCITVASAAAYNCTDADGDGFGDAYYTVTENTNDGNTWRLQTDVNNSNAVAENFTVTNNVTITRVGLLVRRGTPLHSATLDVQIRTKLGDSGTAIASYSIPADQMTSTFGGSWVYTNVTFNLTAGTEYFLALGSAITGLNAHIWQYNSTGDPYPGGALWSNGAPVGGKADSDGTFQFLAAGNLSNCTYSFAYDCNDSDANTLPPYYGMIINNDTYLCSGVYNVTGDSSGITFNSSGIKLVCQDTTINNNESDRGLQAIYSDGMNDTSVIGCTISNYNQSYGIYLNKLMNMNITNNTFIHNGEGIRGEDTTNVWVYNNSFYNHSDPYPKGFGASAQRGAYNWVVQNNYFENTGTVDILFFTTGSGNLIENNTCNSPGPGGIVSMGMNDTIIRYNTAYGHRSSENISINGYGIIVAIINQSGSIIPEYRAQIYNNTLYNNDAGIAVLSNYSLIENNTIYNNTYGILLQNQTFTAAGFFSPVGHNNTFGNNSVYDNTNGVYIENSSLNTFSKITFTGNTKDFISAGEGLNNTVTNCTFNKTSADFTYDGDLTVSHSQMTGTAPYGYAHINKFLEITNSTGTPAPFINVTMYYSDADIVSILSEDSLRIWRYSGGAWGVLASTVDTAANTVTGYITSFSGFGIFGTTYVPPVPGGGSGGGGKNSYNRMIQNTPITTSTVQQPAFEPVKTTIEEPQKEQSPEETPAAEENNAAEPDKEAEQTETPAVQWQPSKPNKNKLLPGILTLLAVFGAFAYLILKPLPKARH